MIHFIIPAMVWTSPKTEKWRDVIDGYYTQGKSPNWLRLKRYEQWKKHVQEHAAKYLELPLRAMEDSPICVVTLAYFASRVHPDSENVHKSVVDALCYVSEEEQALGVKRGSDKYFGGAFAPPRYDKEEPRVEVWIVREFEDMKVVIEEEV